MAPASLQNAVNTLLPLLVVRHDGPSNADGTGPAVVDGCTLSTCDLDSAYVTYVPTLAGNALFLALFSLLFLIHMPLALRHRTLGFGISFFFGLILEIIGYVGRIQMHFNPFDRNAFLMYLICLTIGPVFLAAGCYLCLSRIIVAYDPEERFTWLRPRTYMLVFCACDILSLVLQAIGGAEAATATTWDDEDEGTHIMVGGLAFQVFSLVLFSFFALEFAIRARRWGSTGGFSPKHRDIYGNRRFSYFLFALAFAIVFILIRSIFRVAELSGGFSGSLANNQASFMVLDGVMILLATIILAIFHPGFGFSGHWKEADFRFYGMGRRTKGRKIDEAVGDSEVNTISGVGGTELAERKP